MNAVQSKIISHPFFHGMSPEHLEMVAQKASEIEFGEGEVIFREGQPANRFFLLESGRISLESRSDPDNPVQVHVLGIDEVFGWSWLFPPFAWHLDAKALESTRVIALDGGHLLVACETDPCFGYELMKRITKIVIARMQQCQRKAVSTYLQPVEGGVV